MRSAGEKKKVRHICVPVNDATQMHIVESVNELGSIISGASR